MDNKSKTRQKRKTRIARLVVTLCFGAYVLMIMWNNHKLIITHAKSLINGQARIGESINKISDGLRNDFADKYDYINLNGLFTRLAGKRKNNEVVLLNDGTETEPRPYREMKDRAKNMIDFSQWLEGRGIPFLYVQAPDKVDIEGTVLPVGISDNSNAEADELLSLLNRAGVRTLDLRPFTVDTQENSRYYFYDTDHHWNPRGGFVGYQKIAEAIQNIFPEINYDESYLEPDQWNLHTKEKWFLGSRGRRVGIYFGGVDDLIWYTPAFETKISCSIPFDNQFYKGQFEDAFIRLEHIKSEKADYFITEHYNMYVGRDFALVQQRNPAAKSALKVLMIKDSFTRTTQAFMSVLFKEVDVLDLRCYSAGTLAEYVKNEQPDIVVQMIYPGSFFTDAQFQYGVEKRKQRLALDQPRDFETVWAADELEINVLNDENDKDPIIIEHAGNRREERPGNSICGLRSGKTYRFSFDEAVYTAGKSDYLIAAVHDDKENKDLQIRMIDIEYYNENGGYSWTFTIPEESGDELSFVIQFGESSTQEAEDADGTDMETKAKSREKNEYKRVITLKNPAVSATTR